MYKTIASLPLCLFLHKGQEQRKSWPVVLYLLVVGCCFRRPASRAQPSAKFLTPCPTVLWYTYVTGSLWFLHLLLLRRSAMGSSSSFSLIFFFCKDLICCNRDPNFVKNLEQFTSTDPSPSFCPWRENKSLRKCKGLEVRPWTPSWIPWRWWVFCDAAAATQRAASHMPLCFDHPRVHGMHSESQGSP